MITINDFLINKSALDGIHILRNEKYFSPLLVLRCKQCSKAHQQAMIVVGENREKQFLNA